MGKSPFVCTGEGKVGHLTGLLGEVRAMRGELSTVSPPRGVCCGLCAALFVWWLVLYHSVVYLCYSVVLQCVVRNPLLATVSQHSPQLSLEVACV